MLHAKLHRPPITRDIYIRNHLLADLDHNLDKPLTLVSAPAGYGKSILISSWLEKGKHPYAWISLDAEHNNLWVFLEYLFAAVNKIFPGKWDEAKKLLIGNTLPPLDEVAETVINCLDEIEEEWILVLDDYHLIDERKVHGLIDQFLQYPPQNLHLVLITRKDPPLKVNSLRAYSRIHEIRMHSLSFGPHEIPELLFKISGIKIDDHSLAEELSNKTEGWITAIRLTLLRVHDEADVKAMLNSLQGDSYAISEFLVEEVLADLDQKIRDLLVRISILDRFNAGLIEALGEENDLRGSAFLEWLLKANLFVIAMDERHEWYRYHHLFQRLLQNQLRRSCTEEGIFTLHSRASTWFENQGLIDEAIQNAMKGQDTELAVQLVSRHRQSILNQDRWIVFDKWLSWFPESVILQEPELLITRFWSMYFHFDRTYLPGAIGAIEALMERNTPSPAFEGEIDFFKGFLAVFLENDGQKAAKYLESTFDKVPESYYEVHAQAEVIYGMALQMEGKKDQVIENAQSLFLQRANLGALRETRLLATVVFLQIISGDLNRALALNRKLIELSKQNNYFYSIGWGFYLKGLIHFFQNKQEAAMKCFQQALEYKYTMHSRAAVDAMAGLAIIYETNRNTEKAKQVIQELSEFIYSLNDPGYLVFLTSIHFRVEVLQGKLPLLLGAELEDLHAENMAIWLEVPQITRSRPLIAEGSSGSLKKAEVGLIEVLEMNQRNHNILHCIIAYTLITLVYVKQEQEEEALDSLESAIKMATPGRVIQPFVDAGREILPVLEKLPKKHESYGFVHLLITEFQKEPAEEVAPLLSERNGYPALTLREVEVMGLVADGLRNKEIAAQLFISLDTVKKHLFNIYGKLGVRNRIGLISKARKSGLLPSQ